MNKIIAVLPGDGVGPEVTTQAVNVLKQIAKKFNRQFSFKEGLIGHAAIKKIGDPLPDETFKLCLNSDAILFGAIGDPSYDNNPKAKVRPEQGLLSLRKKLGLYANLRPILSFPSSIVKSPLKPEIIKGVDFIVVRELIGGIYFGLPRGRSKDGNRAFDTCVYTKQEILKVTKYAFMLAKHRKKKVAVVDKANVLETSRLWREVVKEYAKNHPEIVLEFMFVDNAAMQIIKKPKEFDIILTENMFGDILTDEASVITGSIGMLPSASVGEKTALFEPIHGSYPEAAGKNTANPIGAILSAALLLEYSFQMKKEAFAIRQAVESVLNKGYGTQDIFEKNPLSTIQLGEKIAELL